MHQSVEKSIHETGVEKTDVYANVQGEEIHPSTENPQNFNFQVSVANRQKLAQPLKADKPRSFEGMAPERPNARTGLGKTHVQSHIQSVGVQVMGSNHPMMGQVKSSSNWQHIAPSEAATHLDLTRPAANSPSHVDDLEPEHQCHPQCEPQSRDGPTRSPASSAPGRGQARHLVRN